MARQPANTSNATKIEHSNLQPYRPHPTFAVREYRKSLQHDASSTSVWRPSLFGCLLLGCHPQKKHKEATLGASPGRFALSSLVVTVGTLTHIHPQLHRHGKSAFESVTCCSASSRCFALRTLFGVSFCKPYWATTSRQPAPGHESNSVLIRGTQKSNSHVALSPHCWCQAMSVLTFKAETKTGRPSSRDKSLGQTSLLVTSASLLETRALLLGTRSY